MCAELASAVLLLPSVEIDVEPGILVAIQLSRSLSAAELLF
jgi:hypothetical protein